jgi:hypothetical protein
MLLHEYDIRPQQIVAADLFVPTTFHHACRTSSAQLSATLLSLLCAYALPPPVVREEEQCSALGRKHKTKMLHKEL